MTLMGIESPGGRPPTSPPASVKHSATDCHIWRLLSDVKSIFDENRSTFVAQTLIDATTCPDCGEELLYATVRCEQCQEELDRDRAIDAEIDSQREQWRQS